MDNKFGDLAQFIEAFAGRLARVERALNEAWWEASTASSPEASAKVQQLIAERMTLFTSPQEWQQVQRWYDARAAVEDDLLRRQVALLYLDFAANQRTPEQIAEVAALESKLEEMYATFRGAIDGKPVGDNEILELLSGSDNSAVVQSAWLASKQIGAAIAPQLLHLVRLRNTIARAQGFPDYYTQQLVLQEIAPETLEAILDEVDRATAQPYVLAKQRLDERLADRFGIAPDELYPWHYSDPFFQSPPPGSDHHLDRIFEDQDLVELGIRSFASQGFEVGDIVESSDLWERPNKNQHAFCIQIDRERNDVRVLCNMRPTMRWMSTLLHELGHAVYDKYIPASLPYLLRSYAHINLTEAIAMLMGRLVYSARWLQEVRQLDITLATTIAEEARQEEQLGMLIFARWVLVMVKFERALYAEPERGDLNGLWWDLVERYQLLRRPPDRNEPDWASKIHLATAPVYYHNYLLGELIASQLEQSLARQLRKASIAGNPEIGPFLRERLFDLGARYEWNETIRRVTGEPLTARYFVEQYVATARTV